MRFEEGAGQLLLLGDVLVGGEMFEEGAGQVVESAQLLIAFVEDRGVGGFSGDADDGLFAQCEDVAGCGADRPGEERCHHQWGEVDGGDLDTVTSALPCVLRPPGATSQGCGHPQPCPYGPSAHTHVGVDRGRGGERPQL
ncbi:hypothetical protein BKP42_67080 [Rhodococcus erythropolis]|nr:hypothetical protein BKP42_67080 [Rhodococcus erythropolis]